MLLHIKMSFGTLLSVIWKLENSIYKFLNSAGIFSCIWCALLTADFFINKENNFLLKISNVYQYMIRIQFHDICFHISLDLYACTTVFWGSMLIKEVDEPFNITTVMSPRVWDCLYFAVGSLTSVKFFD